MSREETVRYPTPEPPKVAGGAAPLPVLAPAIPGESLFDALTFAARAARRRRRLSLSLLAAGITVTLAADALAPRTYEVEARVLVLRAGSGLAGAKDSIAPDEKRDAKEYEEQVRSRANLEAIVRDATLVPRWEQCLSPLDQILDRFGTAVPEARAAALTTALERALKVTVDTGTVVISVDWPDPVLARDIVHAAVEKFVLARHATEVGGLSESRVVLEHYADDARREADRASSALRLVRRAAVAAPTPAPEASAAPPPAPAPAAIAASDPEVTERTREAEERLQATVRRYDALRARLDEAKIEERVEDVAFAHRYQVVRPADYPQAPRWPVSFLVGFGGALLTALLILIAAAVADAASDIVREPRRVGRRVKLPVLGEASI